MRGPALVVLVALSCLPFLAFRTAAEEAAHLGRAITDVIEEIRGQGVDVGYSSRLVGPDLRVLAEPESDDPVEILHEILRPHGLTLREDAGVLLVVRQPPKETSSGTRRRAGADVEPIETIMVSASRYEIARDVSGSSVEIDRRTIQSMPDVGEDPIRVTHRMPGVAASGISARSHFRGGEEEEVGIILNGKQLFDPFHIRDYQSVFSAIDARAIKGVEVFTGGFPARFGDRMSGVVLMESLETRDSRHTEIGLSVFNTSLLTVGNSGNKQWLLSARRGNLDLVIDPKFGEPSYYDLFGQFAVDLAPNASLTFNALYADDSVRVVLETDPVELEQAESDTRNAQFWLSLHNRWSETLSSSTVLSVTDYSNLRVGETNDAEKIVSAVFDERDVKQVGFRQDWSFRASETHLVQWGLSVVRAEADYDYRSTAQYFGVSAVYPGQPSERNRAARASPRGGSYSLYVADRWRLSPRTTFEWGLRWDDQTYTELASDAQLSPRVSLLRRLGANTDLRFSWGRYHQSQAIQHLQIEDGITNFWPAQRADHWIAGIRRRLGKTVNLRAEVFYKDIADLRPRFENLFDPLGLIPEVQPDRVRLDPSSARAGGLELSIERIDGKWAWWGSYTLSRVTDRIDGVDEPRSWDQRHAIQAGVNWDDGTWDISVAAHVRSGWPTTSLMLVENGVDSAGEPVFLAVPGPRNAERFSPFASVDFRIGRSFALPRGTLLAFLEVSNALNRRNVCCVDWDLDEDESGRPLLESSNDYWLPLLPSVGVLWEF